MKAKMFRPFFYCNTLLCVLPYSLFAQTEMKSQEVPFITNNSAATQLQVVPERAQQLLDFWFGPLSGSESYPSDKEKIWFAENPDSDRQIREDFSQDMQQAINGDLNSWRETPKGRLALILLLDQFSRTIYRNTPQAFASDAMAKGLVLEGLQRGDDRRLYPVERAFFYLPLQHAEDQKLQSLSVASYRQLVDQSPDAIKPKMQEFLRFALVNQQVISRFGRFPQRNAALGRESTPEEIIYLSQRRSPLF